MRLAVQAPSRPAAAVLAGRPETDAAYQRRLALSLIGSVGHDAAVRYCRNNSWDGVLRAILALPRHEDGLDGLRRIC